MLNFEFQNPTRIVFGQGEIAKLSRLVPAKAKVLLIYGGGSIKKNGVYQQVMSALSEHQISEFSGVEPNPRYETLMKAVDIIKQDNIDYLLAVGGGSVIDGTKFIAAAAEFDGEPWDILAKAATVKKAMPFATVLTLPATGSEMNCGSVVTHEAKKEKRAFLSPLVFPKFSIVDPQVTYSLPARQVGNGVVDAFTHVMEQYLTYPAGGLLQDRFAESILQTLIEVGPTTLAEPENYPARASFVWSATMALNGLIGAGVPQDWATHMIGHELTALHGLDHAQTLAIVLPSVMRVQAVIKKEKILQYAERVWQITEGSEEERITLAIDKTREFFEAMGVKTRLSDYGIDAGAIPEVLEHIEGLGTLPLGEGRDIDKAKVNAILQLSV